MPWWAWLLIGLAIWVAISLGLTWAYGVHRVARAQQEMLDSINDDFHRDHPSTPHWADDYPRPRRRPRPRRM